MFNNNKKMIREIKDEDLTVSPACTKPPVVGSTVILGDCVEGMKEYPDKWFDLAIVDPPYGIDYASDDGLIKNGKVKRQNGTYGFIKRKSHNGKKWDLSIPEKNYFIELFRVSKNQIIWGANYYLEFLPSSKGILCWDKKQMLPTFSRWEMAWTSFDNVAKILECDNRGFLSGETNIHPTQKPVKLYDFCFKYSKLEAGAKILDTHLGSGSSRISADKNGFDFTGFEIDKEYYDLSEKRFNTYKSQLRIEGW